MMLRAQTQEKKLIFSENYDIIIVKSKDDSIVKKGVAVESIGDELQGKP